MHKVVIGSDQVGYPLKQAVIGYLTSLGLEVEDMGVDRPDVVVDYPDYAQKVAWEVVRGNGHSGIVICGTGIGVSIAANKVPGARAALCFDTYTTHQARAHNDANILAMGAWVTTPQRAVGMLDEWLKTGYEQGRHIPRVSKLNQGAVPVLDEDKYRYGVSISIRPTSFAPVLFSGRWEEGLQTLAINGLRAVELSIYNVEDIDLPHLQELLQKYDIHVSALATSQSCMSEGLCLAAIHPNMRQMAIQRMKAIADLAKQLNAYLVIGGVRGSLVGTESQQREQRIAGTDAIGEVVHYAGSMGVTSLIEPINRYEINFINSIEEALDLLDDVGDPHFKILADTFHMNIEEPDILESLQKAGDRLGYLHVADSNRRVPGWGHTDFPAIFRTLQEMGYNGKVNAEILPHPDEISALEQVGAFFARLHQSR